MFLQRIIQQLIASFSYQIIFVAFTFVNEKQIIRHLRATITALAYPKIFNLNNWIIFAGDITVADDLHREPKLNEYKLTVRALDTGTPSRSSETVITVKVSKSGAMVLNDITFHIREDIRIGTKIGALKTESTKSNLNNVRYDIDESSSNGEYNHILWTFGW